MAAAEETLDVAEVLYQLTTNVQVYEADAGHIIYEVAGMNPPNL